MKNGEAPVAPIKNDRDHAAAIREIDKLWGSKAGTREGNRFEVLVILVDAYESGSEHHRIGPPDPIEAILFRMDQMGLTRADLVRIIGSRSRVSEVLGYRRPLSMTMIARLHDALGISADVLIGQHIKQSRAA